MHTQTVTHLTLFQVSEMADAVLEFGNKRHYSFRLITDFRGPISSPVFSKAGDWVYLPIREEDKAIIPNAAFKMHRQLKKDRHLRKMGYRDIQVIVGHELWESPETVVISPPSKPELETPRYPVVPVRPTPSPEIDWEKAAQVAGGVLVGVAAIAAISIHALLGSLALVDPSYCICLNDGEYGSCTVVELLRWDTEV